VAGDALGLWSWLSGVPGGAVAFFVLAGPAPGVRLPRRAARRLTGAWAFLLSLLLTPLVTSLLGLDG